MTAATWGDVATALARPASDFTAEQQAQITYWLGGIELIISARFGGLSTLDPAMLKYVETEAVAAKVPPAGATDGATSVTVGVDDSNVTRRWEKRTVSASDITDEWWELLSPARESKAFSTRPGFARDACYPRPDVRVDLP